MFWRKTKAAIGNFHPLHQGLIWQRGLSAAMRPADWAALVQSLAGHDAVVKRRKWAPPHRTHHVLVPLIRVLSQDMRPDGVLAITADLRGPDFPEKLTPQRDLAVQRPIRSIKEWYSIDPWLRIRAELRDGSVLDLSVTDRVRYRKIHKVVRGKHKTKQKTKVVQQVTATRRLRRDAPVRQPAVPPPSWLRVRVRNDRRMVIRTSAKFPKDDAQLSERILYVLTEAFRWTPPGLARPARRTS
ncbi:hypothetical protein SAMN04489712_10962 [Thermomonospora echinospora]|uniref:Uncharacterized protein n=1 Tax=Thermomonospora echinospora TaxID=1992 RepID=A0A1H6C8B6_9ACTN|nr:hypothetical protein [Thermomonospora echinospora]SEG69219.1 hypothetical protein SAMN04489712_10962 [Thermomonospora echinospora]